MTDMPGGPYRDTASIAEILRHIPHRYPFVMIDRMVSCVEGKSVRCIKNVTATEWFFQGPGAATGVMPSMLLVEALAQSSGALSHYSGLMKHMSKPIIFFAGIDQCVFGRDVRVGDTVVLDCTLIRALRGMIKVKGVASVDGEMAAELTLMAVVRDMEGAGN
jgi:3-hydroxyacyl-[acyl-carrier-protein] dehydratase